MLVKCVCSNCAHSYLADDQQGDLACPRCGVNNEGTRNPSDIPDAPVPNNYRGPYDHFDDDDFGTFGQEEAFDPKAPPPMFITTDRMVRGLVFGGIATGLLGAAVGAAMGATRVAVPLVVGVVLALVGGASCRYGFGGRSAPQTKGRAIVCLSIVVMVGMAGYLTGSWLFERWTGNRAAQMRDDLNHGLRSLTSQHAREGDEGTKIMLEERLNEVHRLQALSDAQLEDYLWVQEAELFPNERGNLNVPLLAYGKIRATKGPAIRFGPDNDPVKLPKGTTEGLLAAELLVGIFLGMRGVSAKKSY